MPRHTKIVATIGPKSREKEVLRALLVAGVNVCRVNCSHATADSIRSDVARIRRMATELDKNVGILLDLQGPKIRTGPASEPIELVAGDTLTIRMDSEFPAEGKSVGTTWTSLSEDVAVGDPVLFADGAFSGTVAAVRPDAVEVLMDEGGLLGSHKGINLPASNIQAPALTAKDRADLAVGVGAGVDFVALSFVRSGNDVDVLRAELTELGFGSLPVIAKIEKPEGVENVGEILDRVQGLMVARGDLGVEIPLERVPVVQKQLIEAANRRGAVVITATQMLDSMERNPRPTRAEITDVANAILDGTDAVMLSGETAMGKYPVEAVEVMDRIARQVEGCEFFEPPPLDYLPDMTQGAESTVCRAACHVVRERPRPLVVFTWSGNSAIKASKSRPPKGIYAITHDQTVCDRLSLCWGVTSLKIPVISGTDDLIAAGERALMKSGLLPAGTEVVILAGHVPMRGATNMMKVEIIDGRSS